jgi:hypothetical protein
MSLWHVLTMTDPPARTRHDMFCRFVVALFVLGSMVHDPVPSPADTDQGCVHQRSAGQWTTSGDCP